MTASDSKDDPREADAFISHSSKDKHRFVRPLVECLVEQGAHVWYDEYSMSVGDSLSASVDRGLTSARSGVVIISPAFIDTALESGWTHYELRGIVSNSMGAHGRRIVPVWLDVTVEDVRAWSPPMSDLLSIDASSQPIEGVALEILKVIAPELAGGLARFRALRSLGQSGAPKQVDPSTLIASPVRDRRVAGNVPLRALLVTQILSDCGESHATDLEAFLENLSRDLHHERELRTWEAIAASYSVACHSFDLNADQRKALYTFLLMASNGRAHEPSMDILTAEVAGAVWEHFRNLAPLIQREVVIGEGGLRGFLRQPRDAASSDGSAAENAESAETAARDDNHPVRPSK